MTEALTTEVRGRVLVLSINRPEARNAINGAVIEGLLAGIDQLDTSPDLSAGVLTGAGKGFSAGMDLKDFVGGKVPAGFGRFVADGCRKPLIAAVEGFAVAGGLELCLTADLIVAANGAKFGLPEVKVGLMAAGGGLIRLPRLLPPSVAMDLALTGDNLLAEDLYRYGLVNRLTEPGAALATAVALAERIARNAPLAVAASKQVVRLVGGRTEVDLWDAQKPFMREVFRSADAKEGARAFGEKRNPEWTGA